MSKARPKRKAARVEYLNEAFKNNQAAIQEGPRKKSWSQHDLKNVNPLTPAQSDLFHAWSQGSNVVAHGCAGTGKTFLALYLALTEVIVRKEQSRIILVRSAVPTREVGFLPGTLEEKTALYELPYDDICYELVGRKSTYQDMKDAEIIEFTTTTAIRGITWDNAVVIVDEGENMTFHEIDSIMTRVGHNTRIIFAGDAAQTDLDGSRRLGASGIQQYIEVTKEMNAFESVEFFEDDIVRSEFVKSWIKAKNRIIK